MRVHAHGVDGSLWKLTDSREPIVLTDAGIKGLFGAPRVAASSRVNATRPGSTRTSTRYEERTGTLPVAINGARPAAQLRDAEERWWAAWSADAPTTLEVQLDGRPEPRFLDVYMQDDGDLTFTRDPDMLGRYVVTMNVIAHDPLWRSPVQKNVFANAEPDADFFGRDEVHGQDGGPDYWLSPAYLPIVKQLRNSGNVPAPVRWILDGPLDGFAATIDGRTVGGPIVIPDGQTLIVDSDTNTATLYTGAEEIDVWRELTSWQFARLAPGKAATVSIEREGTGGARLEWTPQHLRAR